jgi:hypothetical protein
MKKFESPKIEIIDLDKELETSSYRQSLSCGINCTANYPQ